MPEERLIFLHLSDIHFCGRSGRAGDIDQDVRDELERDVELVRKNFPSFTGVLVSGDVAFSGQQGEYDTAKTWLTKLCGILGCPPEEVWTIPGNHDVDRSVIRKSLGIRNLHSALRPQNAADVEKKMSELLGDSESFDVIHRPFAEYNRFAQSYECPVGVKGKLFWEHDLELNDGSWLRLRGANSALISNQSDDDQANRLVVSSFQSRPTNSVGVTHLLMCHHPPDWIWERDSFSDDLKARVPLALFGHKHVQRIERVNNTLRVFAGAVQPERGEAGWLPRYNFLAVSVEGTSHDRALKVDVYPRLWHDPARKFRADFTDSGKDFETHRLPLPPWAGPAVPGTTVVPEQPAGMVDELHPGATVSNVIDGRVMNPERKLTFRFFKLPFSRRMEVVQKLGLIHDEDEGVREEERYPRYFQRAKERHLLAEMWHEVESRLADGKPADNPFVGAK